MLRGWILLSATLVSLQTLAFAIDDIDYLEYDNEIQDDEVEDALLRSMELMNRDDYYNSQSKEKDNLPVDTSFPNDLEKMILDSAYTNNQHGYLSDNRDLPVEENSIGTSKRSFYDAYMIILRKLFNWAPQHSEMSSLTRPTTCTKFPQLSATHKVTCATATTKLGKVEWCHLTCAAGYRSKNQYPQYELCGSVTKYRWSYQLRGELGPEKRCESEEDLSTKQSTASICTTPQCLFTGAYYVNKINFSVNPCDNFFEYACGRWKSETTINPTTGMSTTYGTIRHRVRQYKRDVLSQPISKKDPNAVKKAKKFYTSCMHTDFIDYVGSEPLLKILKGPLSWPIIDNNWDPYQLSLEDTMAVLRGKYNNQVLLHLAVRVVDGIHTLTMRKGKMPLPLDYYLEEDLGPTLNAYYSLMYDVALMLGADRGTAYEDVENVRNFERRLAYHKKHDYDFDVMMTVGELNDVMVPSQIDFVVLFKKMIKSHRITSASKILVKNTIYLKNLAKLIQNTDERVLQNYMIWRFIKHRMLNLGSRFRRRYLEFEEVHFGKTKLSPRWEICSNQVDRSMKYATGYMFIDEHFSKAKKEAAKTLFHDVHDGFVHLLNTEVHWMDEQTKAAARLKAKSMTGHFGYNRHLYRNLTFINEQSSRLRISKFDYFGNTLRALTMIAQDSFELLGSPYDRSVYHFTLRPSTVNAFYSPSHNAVSLPAGEMQYPFYWGDKYSWMFQFGAIGTILGHEVTHGYDNNGRHYDQHGHRNNWWTQSATLKFNQRAKCIEDQYSSFYWESAGLYLNGKKCLGENIADCGGIRNSYEGYKLWLKRSGTKAESHEPSTGLTNEQIFFVGFANVRCNLNNEASARHQVYADVHSPGQFRIIGSLQNFDKFSDAFNCPLGSYMNPVKKCILW